MMKRTRKGMLLTTTAGAMVLAVASAEAAFIRSGGSAAAEPAWCGSLGGSEDTTPAGCGTYIGTGQTNTFEEDVADLLEEAGSELVNNFAVTARFETDLDGSLAKGPITVGNLTLEGLIFKDEGTEGLFDDQDEAVFGEWSYSESPGLFAIATKGGGGTDFGLFLYSDFQTAGNWTMEWQDLEDSKITEVSFIQGAVVPLPAAAWMMIGGLGLVAGVARKFRRPDSGAV